MVTKEMNRNLNFDIIFYVRKWENFTRRPLVEAIANAVYPWGKVLVVQRPISPIMSLLKHRKDLIDFIMKKGIKKESRNIYVFTPFEVCHNIITLKFPLLAYLNRVVLSIQIKKIISFLNFNNKLISWIFHPFQRNYLGLMDEGLKVYNISDKHRCRPIITKRKKVFLKQEELKILSMANIVIASSKMLYDEKKRLHTEVYYIPNAVEFEHFVNAAKEIKEPDDIKNIPKPRIGLIGNINEIVDIDLLIKLAELHPEWSIVLIGRMTGRKTFQKSKEYLKFIKKENVHYLGSRNYRLLPSYLKGIDICLLPYKIIEYTKYIAPNKMYQYLASGKPVVSTDFNESMLNKEIIDVASDINTFEQCIKKNLYANKTNSKIAERIKFAKENSWEKRAEQIVEIIDSTLKNSIHCITQREKRK